MNRLNRRLAQYGDMTDADLMEELPVPSGNVPPTGADLAALKIEFARHADCAGVAEIRAEMLRQYFAGDLAQRTVLDITAWLRDGCDKPSAATPAETPAPAAPPVEFRTGMIVTNAAGQIVRLYARKADGRLYGKVRVDGAWVYEAGAMRGVRHLTADEAAAYGRATDHCVFCGHGLEDERSTTVGYGPVCADNYGLPWGAKG